MSFIPHRFFLTMKAEGLLTKSSDGFQPLEFFMQRLEAVATLLRLSPLWAKDVSPLQQCRTRPKGAIL